MTTSSKKYFVTGSVVLALTFCGTVTAVSDSTSYKYSGKDWPGLCKTVSYSDLL